jgi:hypothetical protein|tara:strand:- start:1561 stop:1794 length:234 start_codon:yes stop_codon:yes gene_type:complete
MNEIKCDCGRKLTKDELSRDKTYIPTNGMPVAYDNECFACYAARADFDGPNNSWPNHVKDKESYHETLKDIKEKRDN